MIACVWSATTSGRCRSLVAGSGGGGYSGDGTLAVDARLNNPGSTVMDSAGNIYFCDSWPGNEV